MHFTIKKQLIKFMTKLTNANFKILHSVSPNRHQAPIMPAHFQLSLDEQKLLQCLNSSVSAHHCSSCSCPGPPCWVHTAGLQLLPQNTGLYLRVIGAVRSEGMVGLMPQWGTVLGSVVVGLWHIYDCFIIEGYCISIEGPVSAVYLVCKAKIQCLCGGVNFVSSLKANIQNICK